MYIFFFKANFSKKSFDIIDFGVCFLDDLVGELKESKEIIIDQAHGLIKLYRKGIFESMIVDRTTIGHYNN